MWQAVATRDWPPTGLTTGEWMSIPPTYLQIASLIATQPHLHTEALTSTPPPTRGIDPVVHVIHWGGSYYIEDGHHRVVREALRGHTHYGQGQSVRTTHR